MRNKTVLIVLLIFAGVVIIVSFAGKKIVQMTSNVIDRILKNEGGYVNDPDDPGGETKFGISKRSYPHLDIKNLTLADAHAIYEKDFFSKLPKVEDEAFQYQLYDHSVNAGLSRGLKLYKDSVNTVNPAETAKQLRQTFYNKIAVGRKQKFLKGWLKRTNY